MKRHLVAMGVSALALTLGAGSALATGTPPSGSSAGQSNATSQVLPVAVAAPITAPINASVPIAVAGSNGDTRQSNDTSVGGSATNNETDQVIVQGGKGSTGHSATKECGGHDGVTTGARQSTTTRVSGSAINNRTGQLIVQRAGGAASQSNATTQVLPVAVAVPVTVPVNLSVPISIGLPALPLAGGLLTVVGGVLADPLAAVQAAVADPVGTLVGTIGALGLPALPV